MSELDRRLSECREQWQLVPEGSFPQSYRYVEPVRRADGSEAVLRLGPPGDALYERELDAVEWFSGQGGVRVLAVDRPRGAVLLEHVRPGTTLDLVAEDVAVAAAAGVMRALWRPPVDGHRFVSVREWGRSLEPAGRAVGMYAELCDSMGAPVVLHGDLHHFNLLRSGADAWVAIDPKGVVGEPAYETGALLRNPKPALLSQPSPARLLQRRASVLAEMLGFDLARVLGWAYAQAVLSAAWSVEDGEDPSFALAVADLLEPLTRGR
jgi:streptomycin 6-kinase